MRLLMKLCSIFRDMKAVPMLLKTAEVVVCIYAKNMLEL